MFSLQWLIFSTAVKVRVWMCNTTHKNNERNYLSVWYSHLTYFSEKGARPSRKPFSKWGRLRQSGNKIWRRMQCTDGNRRAFMAKLPFPFRRVRWGRLTLDLWFHSPISQKGWWAHQPNLVNIHVHVGFEGDLMITSHPNFAYAPTVQPPWRCQSVEQIRQYSKLKQK